jgi:two-component system phosphate regulon response regulator PhoB
VLVVEDERAVRELLRLHLENDGYRVLVAPDAVIAGQMLLEDAGAVNLLIVDAQLPYMSGFEFVSTIIADSTLPSLPIILITGHENLASRADILDLPCLIKPFSSDELVKLVATTLGAASVSAGLRKSVEEKAA